MMKMSPRTLLYCGLLVVSGSGIAFRLLHRPDGPRGTSFPPPPVPRSGMDPGEASPTFATILGQLDPAAQRQARQSQLARLTKDPFAWDQDAEPAAEDTDDRIPEAQTMAAHGAPAVRLTATLCSPRSATAVLDGKIHRVGDRVHCAGEDFRVVAIREGSVDLECDHGIATILPAESQNVTGIPGVNGSPDPSLPPPGH